MKYILTLCLLTSFLISGCNKEDPKPKPVLSCTIDGVAFKAAPETYEIWGDPLDHTTTFLLEGTGPKDAGRVKLRFESVDGSMQKFRLVSLEYHNATGVINFTSQLSGGLGGDGNGYSGTFSGATDPERHTITGGTFANIRKGSY